MRRVFLFKINDSPFLSKNIILTAAALTAFLPPFMLSGVNIALPAIQTVFGASAVWLSWVATSYLLSSAVFLVPAGKMGDIWGRKRVLVAGAWAFTLATALCPSAPNMLFFIFLRCMQGLGGALMLTMGMAILTSVFPSSERGKALGVNVAAIYLGSSAGPFLGGILIATFGWKSIFYTNVILGFLLLFLFQRFIRFEWREAGDQDLDITGCFLYAFSLVALMYGASILPSRTAVALLGCGLVFFLFFLKRMLSMENPLFDIRLFSGNRVFAFSNIAALINYAATYSVAFLLSLYLQYIKGMSPSEAGIVMVTQPLLQAVLSPITGKLSDRIEPGLLASGGMFSTALGLACFIFLGWDTPMFLIVSALLFLGLGFAFFSSPNTNAIMGSVPARFYGVASGSVGTMRVLGQMTSMMIITVIFALFLGENRITPEYYATFLVMVRICFSISAFLCLVGVFFSFFRGKLHGTEVISEVPKNSL